MGYRSRCPPQRAVTASRSFSAPPSPFHFSAYTSARWIKADRAPVPERRHLRRRCTAPWRRQSAAESPASPPNRRTPRTPRSLTARCPCPAGTGCSFPKDIPLQIYRSPSAANGKSSAPVRRPWNPAQRPAPGAPPEWPVPPPDTDCSAGRASARQCPAAAPPDRWAVPP